MDTLVLDVPAMYADHHVVEVRRILLGEPGVDAVDASAAVKLVEVRFDPERTTADDLRRKLDEAGYLIDPAVPQESGQPAVHGTDGRPYFRHSTAHEIAGTSVAFEQEMAPSGRPLWPCPGVAPTPTRMDGEDH